MQNFIQSAFLRLNVKDVAKAVALAVITAFVGAVHQALTAHGFDVASYDWQGILSLSEKAGEAYLLKNFLSDQDGKVFGKIG